MQTERSTKHSAAVISGSHVYYGDGTMLELRDGSRTDLVAVLDHTRSRFVPHSTVVFTDATLDALNGQRDAVTAAGWEATGDGPWTLYRANGNTRSVAVGCRPAMKVPHLGILFDQTTDPGVLAILLDRYFRAVGEPWRGTCATTALNAIRVSWPNTQNQPLWKLREKPAGRTVGPLIWRRPLTERERGWGYVHTFDATSAYLGSAISAELAWSGLHHTGRLPFDATRPGYWLIAPDVHTLEWLDDPACPPLFRPGRDGAVWMTTPYVKFLRDLGDRGEVLDSYTGQEMLRADGRRRHPPAGRLLRKWGEQLRDARGRAELMAGTPSVLTAVKRTYKDATGGMQRPTMRVYRPDWAHTIIDLWRATLLRRIIEVHRTQGVWPVRVHIDSVSYADCVDYPEALANALGADLEPVPFKLGRYTWEARQTPGEWIAEHETPKRGARRG